MSSLEVPIGILSTSFSLNTLDSWGLLQRQEEKRLALLLRNPLKIPGTVREHEGVSEIMKTILGYRGIYSLLL